MLEESKTVLMCGIEQALLYKTAVTTNSVISLIISIKWHGIILIRQK